MAANNFWKMDNKTNWQENLSEKQLQSKRQQSSQKHYFFPCKKTECKTGSIKRLRTISSKTFLKVERKVHLVFDIVSLVFFFFCAFFSWFFFLLLHLTKVGKTWKKAKLRNFYLFHCHWNHRLFSFFFFSFLKSAFFSFYVSLIQFQNLMKPCFYLVQLRFNKILLINIVLINTALTHHHFGIGVFLQFLCRSWVSLQKLEKIMKEKTTPITFSFVVWVSPHLLKFKQKPKTGLIVKAGWQ